MIMALSLFHIWAVGAFSWWWIITFIFASNKMHLICGTIIYLSYICNVFVFHSTYLICNTHYSPHDNETSPCCGDLLCYTLSSQIIISTTQSHLSWCTPNLHVYLIRCSTPHFSSLPSNNALQCCQLNFNQYNVEQIKEQLLDIYKHDELYESSRMFELWSMWPKSICADSFSTGFGLKMGRTFWQVFIGLDLKWKE